MIINRINSNLVFRTANYTAEPNTNTDRKSENTILALKDINTSVRFERNGEAPKNTESDEKGFMKTLRHKLNKTRCAIADLLPQRDENSEIYLNVLS